MIAKYKHPNSSSAPSSPTTRTRHNRSLYSAISRRTLLDVSAAPISADVQTISVQVISPPLVVSFGIGEDIAGNSRAQVILSRWLSR